MPTQIYFRPFHTVTIYFSNIKFKYFSVIYAHDAKFVSFLQVFQLYFINFCGPGSSDGIANELRTGRSEIESRWARDFPLVQTAPGAHQASCKMGTGSFLGVKWARGVLLTNHPLLVPRSWKSRAKSLPTLWATSGL